MSLSRDELEYIRNTLYSAIEVLDTALQSKQTKVPIPKPPRETPISNGTSTNAYNADTEPYQFDLAAIKWMGKNREPAPMKAQWSWAYAFDQEGEIHPECEALYNEVERYGEVHTQGFIISLGGRENQLLNKRIPKNGKEG